jgi:hypothetical protein
VLYAILCYDFEAVTTSWTAEEDAAVLAKLGEVKRPLAEQGRMGPSLRLMPTTSAVTVRKGGTEPVVLDGPFAETKEQLLGLYVVECDSLEQAIAVAKGLAKAAPASGAYEIRPLRLFSPGGVRP